MPMPMLLPVTTRRLVGCSLAIVRTRVGVNEVGEQRGEHLEYLGAGLRVVRRAPRPLQREGVAVEGEVKQRGRRR